ncbi:MAG TPA: PaaI family thioesterase [Nevskiaceae bacterium]|nr:PaaI family thioesterase [Nevskiaceae bacterium]
MPTPFQPKDPDFRARVAASFARQKAMEHFGITLARVDPGEVELRFDYRSDLTQQDGFIHAGVVAAACDSACGYAAFSLMPAEARVLTVEYKINLLAPAQGDYFRAIGRVVKPGRTITVCDGEVLAVKGAQSKLVATMSATVMALIGRASA